MDFDLSDDTQELRSVCKSFADAEIRPYAAQWSEDATFGASLSQIGFVTNHGAPTRRRSGDLPQGTPGGMPTGRHCHPA